MGNRIHTVLGLGFDKVKFKKDERFNPHVWEEDFYFKDFLPEMIKLNDSRYSPDRSNYDFDVNLFKARVEGKGWYEGEEPIKSLSWEDFAKYSGYATESKHNPLIFTNPFSKDWQRYDNLIDYYLFSDVKKGAVDKVMFLKGDSGLPINIYPSSSYYNKLTGEKLKDCVPYNRWASNQSEMAEQFGFKTVKEWHENVVPEIPYEIRLFCEVAKVFKNPLTIWELRAMIYTYWC